MQYLVQFHFSLTPHPANVRRRIRQLKDYITVSPDWISYALIDDITDAFAPLIQRIEEEVDDIDERILQLHVAPDNQTSTRDPKDKVGSSGTSLKEKEEEAGGNMLKRVGDCRKKVMGLYRLLGNKADVIKGFAKRCNEQWEVAPRSEIGLYLGDIQGKLSVLGTRNLLILCFLPCRSYCYHGGQSQSLRKDSFPLTQQLPRTNQHCNERATGKDRRCPWSFDSPRYHRTTNEYHHGPVGHERPCPRTRYR